MKIVLIELCWLQEELPLHDQFNFDVSVKLLTTKELSHEKMRNQRVPGQGCLVDAPKPPTHTLVVFNELGTMHADEHCRAAVKCVMNTQGSESSSTIFK